MMNSPTQALDINSIDGIKAAMQQPVQEPQKHELSPFEQRAVPMIERGVPVIPLRPRTKIAFLQNWEELASTDSKVVMGWGEEYPDANSACVAKAKLGGVWFFEVDNPEVLGMIEKTAKIPKTFTVTSSPGKAHFYFEQNAASIQMGNAQAKIDGKEAWSARVNDRYVVSAGSIHPISGDAYSVLLDAPVVPAPAWLTDWIVKNSSESQRQRDGERVNASPDGPPIKHGDHDNELFRIGCMLRNAGMGYEQIRDNLVMICEQRCVDHGTDYVDMCERKAKQACKYPVSPAPVIPVLGGGTKAEDAKTEGAKADVSNWRSLFRNVSEMEQGEIEMVVDGVLQEGTCFLGAGPGHGKTLLALALAKAITLGEPLFGIPEYTVKTPRNVIYLIPECGDRAFRKRCEAFRLPQDDRFIARTISSGASLALSEPLLLEAVRQQRPVVFLDTAARFLTSNDENSAAENRMLVNDVLALRAAGAIAVFILHHSKKAATENREAMTLENMLRGTSDFGAMCDQAFGLRLDDHLYNHGAGPMEMDLVNLKDRERLGGLNTLRLAATHKKPGVLFPASYIDEFGNFHPVDFRETKDRTRETLNQLVESDPMMSVEDLCEATSLKPFRVQQTLKGLGWHVAKGGSDGRSPWHKDEGKPCPYETKRRAKGQGVDLDAPVEFKRAA